LTRNSRYVAPRTASTSRSGRRIRSATSPTQVDIESDTSTLLTTTRSNRREHQVRPAAELADERIERDPRRDHREDRQADQPRPQPPHEADDPGVLWRHARHCY